MKAFQRNLNTIVIYNSNTDLGGNSNSNILIFKVIVIVICYIARPCLLITITYILARLKISYNCGIYYSIIELIIHIALVTTIWVFLQNEQLSSIVA